MRPVVELFQLARQVASLKGSPLSPVQIAQAEGPADLVELLQSRLEGMSPRDTVASILKGNLKQFLSKNPDLNIAIPPEEWTAHSHRTRVKFAKSEGAISRSIPPHEISFDAEGKPFKIRTSAKRPLTSYNEAAEDILREAPLDITKDTRFPEFGEAQKAELLNIQREIEEKTGIKSGIGRVSMKGLTDDERYLYNLRLQRAMGGDFLPSLGRPDFVTPIKAGDSIIERPLMAYNIPREVYLAHPNDYALTIESQLNRQFDITDFSHNLNRGEEIYRTSGLPRSVLGFDIMHKQRAGGLADFGKSAVVFDVETPSLDVEEGIRQLSARFYDEAGKELTDDAINIHLKSPTMNLGYFGEDSFEQVQATLGGKVLKDEEVGEALKDFFIKSNRHQNLVAHNAAFDVGMLEEMLKDKRVSGLLSRDAEFQEAVKTFFGRTQTTALVDTLAHARWLIGRGIGVAAEDSGKQFSLENIILQSSFLDDIVRASTNASAAKEEIRSRLMNLHAGEIDTWFTNQLRLMEAAAVHDPNVLRAIKGEDVGSLVFDTAKEREETRLKILRGGALTPFTNVTSIDRLSPKFRDYLAKKGVTTDEEVEKYINKKHTTHLEQMIFNTRDLAASSGEYSLETLLKTGKTVPRKRIISPADWAETQKALREAKVPFAGLSSTEHQLSRAMGQMGKAAGESELAAKLRNQISGSLGIGAWKTHEAVNVFADTRGRSGILAMPLEMMKEFEGVKYGAGHLFETNLGKAEQTFASVSPFQYGDQKRAALYLRPFEGLSDTEVANRMKVARSKLEEFALSGKYGVTSENLESVTRALENSVLNAGVQIGINDNADALFDVAQALNIRVDKGRAPFVTALTDVTPEGIIHSTAMISTAGDQYKDAKYLPGITRDILSAKEARVNFLRDPNLNDVLAKHIVSEDAFGAAASRTADWMSEKILPHYTGKNVAIAAAAGVGYYLFRKHKKSQIYREELQPQPFENESDQKRYESSMPQTRFKSNPLASAGFVQALGAQSIGHTKMGPRKNANLFSGVM